MIALQSSILDGRSPSLLRVFENSPAQSCLLLTLGIPRDGHVSWDGDMVVHTNNTGNAYAFTVRELTGILNGFGVEEWTSSVAYIEKESRSTLCRMILKINLEVLKNAEMAR